MLEDLEAWCPAIRPATVIRSGKKREFVDPSIAVAALGLTPEALLKIMGKNQPKILFLVWILKCGQKSWE